MESPSLDIQVAKLDAKLRADALLIPVAAAGKKTNVPRVTGLPAAAARRLKELAQRHHLAKRPGSIDATILPPGSNLGRIVLVSLGSDRPAKSSDVRNAAGRASEWCARHGCRRTAVVADILQDAAAPDSFAAWVEGAALAGFRFHRRRSRLPDNGRTAASRLCLATASAPGAAHRTAANRAGILAQAVNLTRTIGHEPPNVINPVTLAKRAAVIARKYKLRCRVIDHQRLTALKMGAILAVGQGSASKPCMIILEHRGRRPDSRPIVLVGKAVTLDTGGYSIKSAAGMAEMKYDKCGGAAVIGALVAASALRLPQRIVGIIGAAENMISGEAYRPGDIITAANGSTIEVCNTDAEGRLVLADCLHYAEKKYRPAAIIDLATLTGACTVALGDACAAIFSNDDKLADDLTESGRRTDERLWRLPLWPVYREQIEGRDADLKNTGGRSAGCIVAAMFLKEFVSDKTPWAHLDIAGVANTTKPLPTCPAGATGFGVRLLIDYLQHRK